MGGEEDGGGGIPEVEGVGETGGEEDIMVERCFEMMGNFIAAGSLSLFCVTI